MQSYKTSTHRFSRHRHFQSLQSRALTTVSAFALLAFATPQGAHAAEAAPAQSAQTELEEVVITGSRIIREGYEAPTPLSVVDTEALQSSGTANVADYVNTMPVFSGSATPVSGSQSISAGTSGVNTLNLRSLGAGRTLVLLDGQRAVIAVLTGGVDINTFPQQLVSRVEVVTGGASAVYGSDAVTGVVNFVLDKTYTGVKGEISGGVTSYGDNQNYKIGLSAGFPFANDRGHVLLSGEQSYESGILPGSGGKGKRGWNAQGRQTITTTPYSPTLGAGGAPEYLVRRGAGIHAATPGGIITSGPLKGTAFGPGGVPYQFNYGSVLDTRYMVGGDWYAHDIREDHGNNLTPQQSAQNVFFRAAYDLTDDINVFAMLSFGHNNTFNYCCAQFQIAAVSLKADNAFLPAEVRARAVALGVTGFTLGSFNYDMPGDVADNDRIVNRYVVGASGKLDAFETTWTWDTYFQKGTSRNSINAPGIFQRSKLTQAADAVRHPTTGLIVCRSTITAPANGCVPYNYFGIGVNSPAAISFVTGTSHLHQTIVQDVVAASATGEPIEGWAGPISIALNIEHRRESVSGDSDPGSKVSDYLSGNYRPSFGKFNVTEGALETLVPLANGKPWADNWDLSAAVRFTQYSTSGFATTWKVGTTYAPVPDIKLRITRSRDFRAPNLSELFAGGTAGSGGTVDPFPNALIPTPTVLGLTVGNADLKPEVANTTGIGVVVQPTFIPGLSFSVDYWNINLAGRIQTVARQDLVTICYDFLVRGLNRPGAQAFCNDIIRTNNGLSPTAGGTVVALTAPGILYQTTSRPTNFVASTTRGIDFEASYRFGLEDFNESWAGNVSVHGTATRYLKNYTDDGYNEPTDTVGENAGGAPSTWRYTATLTYDLDPMRVALTARGFSAGTYSNSYIECTSGCPLSTAAHRTIDNNHIDGALYWDASTSYKFAVGDAAEGEAFLNIRNLLNTDPAPVARSVTGNSFFEPLTNLSKFDVLGRVFRAGLRFKM